MKIDSFTHILPKRYGEKILQLAPETKDIDKRVRGASNVATCGLNFFGEQHVLFGTDMPFGPKESPGRLGLIIDTVEGMEIGPEQRKAIYEDNARRILNLK